MAAGFLKRVRRITIGKISALLDGAENPEQIFPQLITEMRDECKKSINAEAVAVAALKRRQQERDEARAELEKWTKRAELAIHDADDALARTAIEEQLAIEKRLAHCVEAVRGASNAAERAKDAREDLHAKLDTLVRKRDEILSRARAAKNQEAVQKVLAGVESGDGASILDAVSRMEDKVAEAEARADAYGEVASDLAGGDAEMKFRDLERRDDIEERLAALKSTLTAGDAADAPEPTE